MPHINWLRHSLALLTGESASRELTREFWPKEDLWSASSLIRFHVVKLIWVYAASIIVQSTLPLLVIGLIIVAIGRSSWFWLGVSIGIAAALGLALAVLIAFATYVRIGDKARR